MHDAIRWFKCKLKPPKKRKVAHSSNLHQCSSHCRLLAAAWVPRCPAPLLTANPSNFLPPAGLCFKVPSERSCSSCRIISQQGLQASPVGERVTGNPMPCSIMGCPHKHPLGGIARRQIWQLLPRLEHGCVESINQLAWYHAQFNTLTEWHRQFCSGETRFN